MIVLRRILPRLGLREGLDAWHLTRTLQQPIFPVHVPQFYVLVVLTEAEGELELRLVLVDVGELDEPIYDQLRTVTFQDKLSVSELMWQLDDIAFPSPREYRLQLCAGDTLIIERRIFVVDPSPERQ